MKKYNQLIWTPEMVSNYWDYESQFPENYFAYGRGAEIARRFRPYLQPGNSILDYGCGPGYLIRHLLEMDLKVAGMDSSAQTRQRVIEQFGDRAGFINAYDKKDLIGSGLRFDVVTVLEVIEHLYDEDLDRLLTDIRSLLNPEGIVIFTTPNEEELEKHYILCPVTNELFHRWQHVRSWSQDMLCTHLEKSGFTVRTCFSTDFNLTFHTQGEKHPLMRKWTVLKKKLKHTFKPRAKQPHLVAVASAKKNSPS